jgi:hypothetical protein
MNLCGPTILMMQTAYSWDSDDSAFCRRLDFSRGRGVPLQGLMRPNMMIVIKVFPKNSSEMIFIEDNHVVETFPANAAN